MTTPLLNRWGALLNEAFLPTRLGDSELAYLAELASHSEQAAICGCYMGASAWMMLKANPRLHLWVCDPFTAFGTKWVAEHFLAEFIRDGRCEVIPKGSKEASEQLAHVNGLLDFVWINGHAETEDWMPLVRSGGLLMGSSVWQAVAGKLVGWYEPVEGVWAWVKG